MEMEMKSTAPLRSPGVSEKQKTPESARHRYSSSSHWLRCTRSAVEEEWLATLVLQRVADARDVCRLALVNRNFLSASLSDVVWQHRLPPKALLDDVEAPALGQRDLYLQLCKSIFYLHGRMKFWLDPAFGGECFMKSARLLRIVWGNDTENWRWKPSTGSMFPEVAYLKAVRWFDVFGAFRQHLRPGKYMLSFRMQFNASENSWKGMPVTLGIKNLRYRHRRKLFQVSFDSTTFKRRPCPSAYMTSLSQTAGFQIGGTSKNAEDIANTDSEAKDEPSSSDKSVTYDSDECLEEDNQWVECDAGEFLVEDDDRQPVEVEFLMREVHVLGWKKGIVLDGVIVRPYDLAAKIIME